MKFFMIYLIAILMVVSAIAGCVYLSLHPYHPDDGMPQYRDGTCECGGTWELFNADFDRGYTYYFYRCNKCDELIKLYEKP